MLFQGMQTDQNMTQGSSNKPSAADLQQAFMAQQLLMLLPKQDGEQSAAHQINYSPMQSLVPSPATSTAELSAFLFADALRKQFLEVNKTSHQQLPPMDFNFDAMAGSNNNNIEMMYRHLANRSLTQPSPMVLAASDITNKLPESSSLQCDQSQNQRFSAFSSVGSLDISAVSSSSIATSCDTKPLKPDSEHTIVEVDARALLAAFLHCLTSEMKQHGMSGCHSEGTASDSTPISVDSDEDLPPNRLINMGLKGLARAASQQRRQQSGSSYTSCNSSISSSSSGKRSSKALSSSINSSDNRMSTSSAGSSPQQHSNGEMSHEAAKDGNSKGSSSNTNESEPFYWVQSFHTFERRNLIRTCQMQAPSQMTFDARRQCFRKAPAVTLYRCNVCGDYTSKHRDKISRHLTLQHSIKPSDAANAMSATTMPSQTSPGPNKAAVETKSSPLSLQEIDMIAPASSTSPSKTHGESSPASSAMSVNSASPTWSSKLPLSRSARLPLSNNTESRPILPNGTPMELTGGECSSESATKQLYSVKDVTEDAQSSDVPAAKKLKPFNDNRSALTQDDKRDFTCHHCPASFKLYAALRAHYAQCHPGTPSTRPYSCTTCDFSTNQLRKLDQHTQQFHSSNNANLLPRNGGTAEKV